MISPSQKEFGTRVKGYLRQTLKANGSRYTLADLAAEIGTDTAELSRKLNSLVRLGDYEAKAIVKTLATFQAITTRQQASEFLTLVACPDFSPADWVATPLDLLADKPIQIAAATGSNAAQKDWGSDSGSSASIPQQIPPATAATDANYTSKPTELATITNELLPPRNLKFVGREAELARLHELLGSNNTVALTALHGMGGVGKTSLALEYFYRHAAEYSLVAWLPAENKLTLELAFIGLLSVMGLPDMPTDTEEAREAAVGAVKKELTKRGKGWLVVFDTAEKVEDIANFRPGGATSGHVIVTSRNRQMGKLGNTVEVDVLSDEDALRLLVVYAYPDRKHDSEGELPWLDAAEKEAAERLVDTLGYLALAITQAGAYIQATGCGVAGYLARFKKAALKLFGQANAKPLDYKDTVTTTWQVSFEALEAKNPVAADLLSLLAFFAPDGIKLEWFGAAAGEDEEIRGSLPDGLSSMLGDELALDDALATLMEYSLVTMLGQAAGAGQVEGETGLELSIHRLVQLVMRERLASETLEVAVTPQNSAAGFGSSYGAESECGQVQTVSAAIYWYNRAVAFLVASFPNETDYYQLAGCDSLITHLQALVDYYIQVYAGLGNEAGQVGNSSRGTLTNRTAVSMWEVLDLARVAILFGRAANYYYKRVFYAQALSLYERAIAICEKTLGSDHPDFAISLNNLAGLLRATGDYGAAKSLFERAIAITEKTLGNDHPELAISFNNLALLLQDTGDYEAAKPLFERAIAIGEKTLGNDHPDLAIRLNNLALLLSDTGDYVAAKPLFERAIAICEKTLGSDHPELAISLNNLAGLLRATGDYGAAKPLYERAIAITEKTLGSDHPQFAGGLNNLAFVLFTAGDYEAAKPLFERAIVITEKTLGSDHPELATSLNNLAGLLRATGDYEAAKPLYERALTITEKTLGSDHPDFAIRLNNLALLLQATGDYGAAKPLFERAIAICEKTLGSDHPDFAISLNNLASLLQDTGDYGAAKSLFERAIAITEKTLGNDHPELAISFNNLALLLQDTGDYEAAKPLFERAIAIGEKTLGNDHPDLATWLNNLAGLLQDTGDYEAAKPLFERAIAIGEKTLGSNHPSLAIRLNNLASLLQATGDYKAAKPLFERAIAIGEKTLGSNHPNLAVWLNNLAGLLQVTGDYTEAKQLYGRALAITEKALGNDHPSVAITIYNIASLFEDTGEQDKAVSLYKRALAIREAKLGAAHPSTRKTASTVARLESELAGDS